MADETTDRGFACASAHMLGLKLITAAKLPEADAAKQLSTVAKDIRESLITLGLRKRKTVVRKEKKGVKKNAR